MNATYHTATATHRLGVHGDVMAALAHGQAEALRLGEVVTVTRGDGALLAVCGNAENQIEVASTKRRGQLRNNKLLGTPEPKGPPRRDWDATVHYDCAHRHDQSLWQRCEDAGAYRCSACGALGYRKPERMGGDGVTGRVWTRRCQVQPCPEAATHLGYTSEVAMSLKALCDLHGGRTKEAAE